MAQNVYWYLVADVSEQHIGPIFIVEVCPETSVTTNLRCVTSQKSEDLSCDRCLSSHGYNVTGTYKVLPAYYTSCHVMVLFITHIHHNLLIPTPRRVVNLSLGARRLKHEVTAHFYVKPSLKGRGSVPPRLVLSAW